jgi:hypothetical protein
MEHTAGCEKRKNFLKKVLTSAFLFGIMAKPSQERSWLKTLVVIFFNHFATAARTLKIKQR